MSKNIGHRILTFLSRIIRCLLCYDFENEDDGRIITDIADRDFVFLCQIFAVMKMFFLT